jgi:hypothetical protein
MAEGLSMSQKLTLAYAALVGGNVGEHLSLSYEAICCKLPGLGVIVMDSFASALDLVELIWSELSVLSLLFRGYAGKWAI